LAFPAADRDGMSAAQSARATQRARQQRDQFVGFAFAGGDVLLETDMLGRISFAAGAGMAVTGRSEAALVGQSILDLVMQNSVAEASRFFEALIRDGRARSQWICFRGTGGRRVSLGGYYSAERPEVLQLSLRLDPDAARPAQELATPEAFTADLLERLNDGKARASLTMIDISGLSDLNQETSAACRREIGAALAHLGEDDGAIGWLSADTIGIAQDEALDTDALQEEMQAAAKCVAGDRLEGLELRVAALPLDADGLKPKDAAQALLYAINSFAEKKGEDFSVQSLGEGFKKMIADTVTKVVEVRATLTNADIDLYFQPIVDLMTRGVHHYEVLSRFKDGSSPFQMVCFAEKVGLITDFDLMVCRRVMRTLAASPAVKARYAVNLSARSMEDEAFSHALVAPLRQSPAARGRLMFELTESAVISDPERVARLIKVLRRQFIPVCLDDFGSGAAAFHYLRAFGFDYVKIDGSYVQSTKRREQTILKGISRLCQELGVISVAEMIEDEFQLARMQRLGIHLGQGYLFGKPRKGLDLATGAGLWSRPSVRTDGAA
jgi:EAL domain-containing protein (putative c-di-GMP-specific phosphodiesterase class I)